MTLKERLLDVNIDLAEAYKNSGAKDTKVEVFYLNKFQSNLERNLFEWLDSSVTFTEATLPTIEELYQKYKYIVIEATSIENFYFNLNKWLFKAEDLDTPNFPITVLVSILAVQNYYRSLIIKKYDNYNS